MKRIWALLISVCMLASVIVTPRTEVKAEQKEETQTQAAVIDAAAYGADPSGREDSAPGIRAAIEAAKEIEGPVILNFPKGEYQIYPDKAFEKELYVSNTVGSDQKYRFKKIGFLFEDMQDVTLEGNGSFFMFHGEMTTFSTINSKNIKFQNFEFDYFVPSVVDLTVESIEGNSAVLYLPECFSYAIDGTSLTVSSDASPYTGQVYWSRKVNDLSWSQLYDVKNGLTWRADKHEFWNLNNIEDIGNHRLKFNYWSIPSEIKEGYSYQARVPDRDHPAMFFWKSRDVVMQDVDVHFLHGFGIVGQHTENVTLKNMDFSAREETGRTTVGFADFIHMSGCKGKILIDGCSFSNPHDDPINVHGTFNQVAERISNRRFKVSFKHYQTEGFPNFFVGDEVEFFRKDSMTKVANSSAKVVEVLGPTGYSGALGSGTGNYTDMIIRLDRDMPEEIWGDSYVVENVTCTPSVEITNNVFKENPTRGILVTTRKPVLIKNNIFDGMTMASIYISNDAADWYESGAVRDVTIEDNIFYRPSKDYGAIFIEPFNWSVSADAPVHENIIIRNNVFYLQDGKVLDAKSVKNLQFTDNQIYRYDPNVTVSLSVSKNSLKVGESASLSGNARGKSYESDLYHFNGCKDVLLSGNLYDGGLKPGGSVENMNKSNVTFGKNEFIDLNGNAQTLPAAGTVTYESSDESIVGVTAKGNAVGRKEGTAKVRAVTSVAGRKFVSDWQEITVSEGTENAPASVQVGGEKDAAETAGEEVQFYAQVKPEGASQEILWSVADAETGEESDRARIDSAGKLTALSNGAVEVVATAANGLEGRRMFVIGTKEHTLDSSWSVINEDDRNWSVAGENRIRINAQPRALWEDWLARNIFLHDLSGDKENLTVCVKMSGNTVGEYEEAGLLLYKDNDNYISLERKHADGNPKIMLVTETNSSGWEQGVDNTNTEDIWFKLEKRSTDITGYFSTDGENWTKVADCSGQTQLGDAFKIGFITGNGTENSTARTPFTFQELSVNNEEVALTAERTAPEAFRVSCAYTEGKLNAAWNFNDQDGDEEQGTLVRWMVSGEADGIYEMIPQLTGNGIYPTASMAGKYVKAAVIPRDSGGLYGAPAVSSPVKIESDMESGASGILSAESSLDSVFFTGLREKEFPAFHSGVRNYMTTATVSEDTVTANLKAKDEKASIEISVNGETRIFAGEQKSFVEDLNIKLGNGYNVICVKVIASDQVTWTDYRFVIIRTGEDNSLLNGIKLNGKPLSSFKKGVLNYSYTAEQNARELMIETEAPERSEVEIFVNGEGSKEKSVQAALLPGKNEVIISVKPETFGSETYYYMEVLAPGDDNAQLKTMQFGSGAALKDAFSSNIYTYQGTANKSKTSLVLETQEENAKIRAKSKYKILGEGTNRLEIEEIPLYQEENKIYIEVTSPGQSAVKTYEISLNGNGDTYIEPSAESTTGYGEIQINKSVDENPIRLRMERGDIKTFEKGIGGHAAMRLVYNIEGMGFTGFSAYMGIDQEIGDPGAPRVKFSVYLDDDLENPVWTTGDEWITSYTPAKQAKVSVAGSKKVTIAADYWESNSYTHVSLGDVRFQTELPRPDETLKDFAAALEVSEKIRGIGTVVLDEDIKAKIETARAAYDALTDAQKKLVDNLNILEKAEADYRQLETGTPGEKEDPPIADVSGKRLQKNKTYQAGKLYYRVLSDTANTVSVTGPVKKTEKSIEIPDTVELDGVTCTVTEISAKAFWKNKKLKKAVIGKNVTVIGKKAFAKCAKLKKITIQSEKLTKAYASGIRGISKKAVLDVPNKKIKAYKKLFGIKKKSGIKVK